MGSTLNRMFLMISIIIIFGFMGIISTINSVWQGTFHPTAIFAVSGNALNNAFARIPVAINEIGPAFANNMPGTAAMHAFVIVLLWLFVYTLISIVPHHLLNEQFTFSYKVMVAVVALMLVLLFGFLAGAFVEPSANEIINQTMNITGG